MIDGWAGSEVSAAILPAPLPVPHRAVYRDGTLVRPVPSAVAEQAVRSIGGASVEVQAGLDAEHGAALEITLDITDVFHGVLIDRIVLDFGWRPCGTRPDTTWEGC